MKKFYSLIISLLPLFALAQPTITQSDLPTAGLGWRTANDTNYVDVIPAGGANAVWDYTGLQTDVIDTTGFMAASATPYGSLFPSSDLASYNSSNGDWSYFDVSSTGLYVNGGTQQGGVLFTLNPALLYIPVPFTYNDTRNSVAEGYVDTMISGFCVRIKETVVSDFVADGYGTLKLPAANYNNVLRIKVTNLTYDSTLADLSCSGNYDLVVGSGATQVTRFVYLRSGTTSPYLLGIDADSLATASTASEYYLNTITGVGVNDLSVNQAQGLYPNPANDRIHIKLAGNIGSPSDVKVFDATGREVYNKTVTGVSLLEIPSDKMASGVYHYSVVSDKHGQSGKFTVVH